MTGRYAMTQTTEGAPRDSLSPQSSLHLPDVFSSALVELFNKVQPSIVQVGIQGRGGGTGVIWNTDGRIITNAHVVANEQARIQVHLTDGRTLEAKVLNRDPRLDLAMLKVKGDNLKALSIGDSTRLRIGEWVFAIGHPWGQRWVVTAGVFWSKGPPKKGGGFFTHHNQSGVGFAARQLSGAILKAGRPRICLNTPVFFGGFFGFR